MSRSSHAAPALAVVIPAPRDAVALEATLVSVLENRPRDCEVIVAHGFAYDDPWQIGDEVRLVPAPPGSGVAACANVGIAASTAPAVHVLAAGWLATPGWTDEPCELLAQDDVDAVVPLGVRADAPDTAVSAGIRVTRGGRRVAAVAAPRPMAPVLEAGFWRAETLAAVGPGFATNCGDWLADADMANALACLDGRVELARGSRVVCGGGRGRPRAFTAGLQSERLFWRSLARGAVARALASHAAEVVMDVVFRPLSAPAMLAGRIAALLQVADSIPRFGRLRALRASRRAAGEVRLRTDAPQTVLPRPRHVPLESRPLRRSA